MKTAGLAALSVLATLIAAVYILNASWLADPVAQSRTYLAHRGVHHTYHREGLTNETCTAARIFDPEHVYLENTLPSIWAAFDHGATVVEIDIHPTTDGEIAVFHDWTLDCRTEGTGRTRDHPMSYLKTLDLGYGYTADGGKTFPLRGKGIGLMPTLSDVLEAFPDERFLINVKGSDGEALADYLLARHQDDLARLSVYGRADDSLIALKERIPRLKVAYWRAMKACAMDYMKFGWSGLVPEACNGSILLLPINYTPWFWGWPKRFLQRMEEAGTDVYLVGPWEQHTGNGGINTLEMLNRIPKDYTGGIWTDRIEIINPETDQVAP